MSSAQENSPRPQVAYLGPIASFSHQAALEHFDPTTADLHPYPSFASIFNALQTQPPIPTTSADNGRQIPITHAIVPIENSSNGTVASLLDLLADPEDKYPDIQVCAEHYLAVHHCLLAPRRKSKNNAVQDQNQDQNQNQNQTLQATLSSIKTLRTHPQVWTQCTRYLAAHLSHAERIDTSSTSAAAASLDVEEADYSAAAIGSSLAASTFDLDVLAANIEDDGRNTTRFLVLRNPTAAAAATSTPAAPQRLRQTNASSKSSPRHIPQRTVRRKSLLTFTLNHSLPGSLASVLESFSLHGFNLTSIDTRPSRRIAWHYIFCVECMEVESSPEAEAERGTGGEVGVGNGEQQGRGGEPGLKERSKVQDMMETLRARTETVRWLGSWEDALVVEGEEEDAVVNIAA